MSLAAERRVELRLSIPPEASNAICQKDHHYETISDARIMKAREKRISMLTRILEPSCSEPFYFLYITAKDGTASHHQAREDLRNCLLRINKMDPMPKFIALCGGFVDDSARKDDLQAKKFYLEEELSCLDPRVKVLRVASSGDFKGRLSVDCIEKYRWCFGDDWYEFWACGIAFLVVNTAYYTQQVEDDVIAIRNEQNDWIDSQLLQQQIFQAKRIFVLQDCVSSASNTGDVNACNSRNSMLEELLVKYNIAGVSHVLCRQNPSAGKDEPEGCGIQILPNEINDLGHWFVRLVKISADEIQHQSFSLQCLPKQVHL